MSKQTQNNIVDKYKNKDQQFNFLQQLKRIIYRNNNNNIPRSCFLYFKTFKHFLTIPNLYLYTRIFNLKLSI